MRIRESIIIALHSMRIGRLRTALTMFGIVLSIAVVVCAASLIACLDKTYSDNFNLSLKTTVILPQGISNQPGGNGARSLSNSDVEALTRGVDPNVISHVIPTVGGFVAMRHGALNYGANVEGASAAILQTSWGWYPLTTGTAFSDLQYRDKARVVVIGLDLVKALFNGDSRSALGATVQLGRLDFQVIGVLGPAGVNTAVVPMTTARAFLFGGMNTVQGITVVPTSLTNVDTAQAEVNAILDRQHFVKDPAQRDFVVGPAIAFNEISGQLLTPLTWFTLGTTGVALFIGALGLANIMLITVTERTWEIGIRRAVGARRSAILRQFLIEALVIAGFGGFIGASLGVALALASRDIVPRYLPPWWAAPDVSPSVVALAFGLSLVVGLIAGVYPAIKASRLHPWNAICH